MYTERRLFGRQAKTTRKKQGGQSYKHLCTSGEEVQDMGIRALSSATPATSVPRPSGPFLFLSGLDINS